MYIMLAFPMFRFYFVVIPFHLRRMMEELHVCINIKIDTNGDMLSRSEGNLLAAITLFAGRQRLTTITAELFTSIPIPPHFMTTKFSNLLFFNVKFS